MTVRLFKFNIGDRVKVRSSYSTNIGTITDIVYIPALPTYSASIVLYTEGITLITVKWDDDPAKSKYVPALLEKVTPLHELGCAAI